MKKVFTIIVYIFAVIGFVLTSGYLAIRFGLTNSKGIIDKQRQDFLSGGTVATSTPTTPDHYWNTLPEWSTLRDAIVKDQALIDRAALTAGVPARLIVAQLVAEQLRFFYDDRESYKKFFEPLKILGSQTKFSWGVMGIKEDTAIQIENHLKDPASPFYLGKDREHILDFATTTDIKQERFIRMTDQHAHYYSYLYAGLYLKQITQQWKSVGFDISNKPEILSTLYNVGFANSKPKADPQSGGAPIPIGDRVYSFGTIAAEFYNSNELVDQFGR